jgi:hypothetical protein
MCEIISLSFSFSFIFAPLFGNRSFSKTLAYLVPKFLNLGLVHLSTLDNTGNYSNSILKSIWRIQISNLNFGREDLIPCFSLFLFYSPLQTDQVEGEDLLDISFWSPEICKSLPLVVCSWNRGEQEKPEAIDPSPALLNPSLSDLTKPPPSTPN